MNSDFKKLVYESFDTHLNLHQDAMTMETYSLVSNRFQNYKNQVNEDKFRSEKDIKDISQLIAEYISFLTYHHIFTGQTPFPPYESLNQNIIEAKNLLEYIKYIQLNDTKIIKECSHYIDKAQRLEFPFNYRYWLLHRDYNNGKVITLQASESIKLSFFQSGESIYERDKPPKHKVFYVRIGQEKSNTKLFELEYISAWPEGQISLYVHHSNNKEKIKKFKEGDFWIYEESLYNKKNIIHTFSAYIDTDTSIVVGNVGSDLGVYIQSGNK